MVLAIRERLEIVKQRLAASTPRCSRGDDVLALLDRIIREVEDEHSGVPEDLDAATKLVPDGRIYPPSALWEAEPPARGVRLFNQRRHETLVGENGALQIRRRGAEVEFDIPGADGRTINELLDEAKNEADRKT